MRSSDNGIGLLAMTYSRRDLLVEHVSKAIYVPWKHANAS